MGCRAGFSITTSIRIRLSHHWGRDNFGTAQMTHFLWADTLCNHTLLGMLLWMMRMLSERSMAVGIVGNIFQHFPNLKPDAPALPKVPLSCKGRDAVIELWKI